MFIFSIIAIVMLVVANLGGFGYFLYMWGSEGIAMGLAAWTAFKFWLLWSLVGVILFFVGLIGNKK